MAGADAELILSWGDVFTLKATFDQGATDEYCYYDLVTPISISTDLAKKFVLRYKTSKSAAGAGARVYADFASGGQWLLGSGGPQFSSTWKVVSGDLNSGQEIVNVRFYADDVGTNGTFYVYYDFLLLCDGIFTFPHVAPGGVRLETPMKTVELDIPGREGGILQRLGMKSPIITLTGDMEYDDSVELVGWRPSGTGEYGEYLFKIIRDDDAWQWLTSDIINCKVIPDTNAFFIEEKKTEDDAQRLWGLRFKLYSLSSLGEYLFDDKQWYGK